MAKKAKPAPTEVKGKAAETPVPAETDGTTASWFKRGQAGLDAKKQHDKAVEERRAKQVNEFWLKVGEEATLVVVDDMNFFVSRHFVPITRPGGKKGGVNVTCTKDFAVCESCNRGLKSTFGGFFTAVDTREFPAKKEGEKPRKNRKVLYMAKNKAISKLADMKKKYGSLVGVAIKVKRYEPLDPSSGADFEYIGKLKKGLVETFGADTATPLDYEKVLAPPTKEELQYLGFGNTALPGSFAEAGVEVTPSGDLDLGDLENMIE